MYRVKNKRTEQIFYFRFFSEKKPEEFWYTKTTKDTDFCYGNIYYFISLDATWDEILNAENETRSL